MKSGERYECVIDKKINVLLLLHFIRKMLGYNQVSTQYLLSYPKLIDGFNSCNDTVS